MTGPVIDPQTFKELQSNAGADFVAELLDTLAEEAPRLIDELRSARQAQSADRFRRAAHSLKSNFSTFGATRVANLARELELNGLQSDASAVETLAREFETTLAVLQTQART